MHSPGLAAIRAPNTEYCSAVSHPRRHPTLATPRRASSRHTTRYATPGTDQIGTEQIGLCRVVHRLVSYRVPVPPKAQHPTSATASTTFSLPGRRHSCRRHRTVTTRPPLLLFTWSPLRVSCPVDLTLTHIEHASCNLRYGRCTGGDVTPNVLDMFPDSDPLANLARMLLALVLM